MKEEKMMKKRLKKGEKRWKKRITKNILDIQLRQIQK